MPRRSTPTWPNQLRRYRKKRHLRTRDVVKIIGCPDRPALSHWEKGRVIPSLPYALKLSAWLNCPVEVIFAEQFNRYRAEIRARQRRYGIYPQYY